MKQLNHEQGTEEWLRARMGVPSASMFKKIITTQGKRSTSMNDYIYKLAAEKITGNRVEVKVTDAMATGTEREPMAREEFELLTDLEVTETGFILHDSETFGCSPDGLIGDDSGLEIKCPADNTHLRWLDAGKIPSDHFAQVQGCMLVTERDHWHFYSYHPDMKPLHVVVERDDSYLSLLIELLGEVNQKINELVEKAK